MRARSSPGRFALGQRVCGVFCIVLDKSGRIQWAIVIV